MIMKTSSNQLSGRDRGCKMVRFKVPQYISNVNSWDTDSNKSFDFLLNPICKVVVL